ncbi:hypothetical protein QGP82_32035 [Leptothoe sp. LEGE 181152]|nr:hypothetical protein [Adonisia turfae]MDV3353348.1 hypothetical protein [Leptothoe sp. LEGE 181152]
MGMPFILVILDGLRFGVSQTSMGYLAHLLEARQASLHKLKAELPTVSRLLCEVLLTGMPVSISSITYYGQ